MSAAGISNQSAATSQLKGDNMTQEEENKFFTIHRQHVIELGLVHLVSYCHSASYNAGWWRDLSSGAEGGDMRQEVRGGTRLGKALVAEKLALVHSEVSESLEAHRKGMADDKLPHRSGIEVELADAVIRIADLAGALELDLAGAILEKLQYNSQRPDHKLENRLQPNGKAY